jgi:TolB protein
MRANLAFLFILIFAAQACTAAPAAAEPSPTVASPTLAPAATATSAPAAAKIAFTTDRDGNFEIYLMNPDGSGQVNLTNNPAFDARPAWSPDGTRIAFESDRDVAGPFPPANVEIYVMNADGSNVVRLTNNTFQDYDPVWSPDGTRIAFGSTPGQDDEVFVINADGSGLTNLTNNPADDYDVSWSSDGQRIAFASDRDITASIKSTEIYVMNADGSGLTRLTNNDLFDSRPLWSPDNSQIAYTSCCENSGEIYLMNADGSDQRNLTNLPSGEYLGSWAPDGQHLIFYSDMDFFNPEIYIIDIQTGEIARLTTNEVADQDPVWSNP